MTATRGAARPDPVTYLAQVASSAQGQAYKRQVLADLELQVGLTVLDVGCGPGTDLSDLADGVSATGTVIGVDHDPAMLAAARELVGSRDGVELRLGDAHALPLGDGSIDRARVDRVLQHVDDPAQVVRELRRVCRPGALVALAEPDWETLAIDAADRATSRAFTRYTCDHVVRNAAVGRSLVRLAHGSGFSVRSVTPHPILFTDFPVADQILGLSRNAARAVEDGLLSPPAARGWLADLAEDGFLACVTLFTVVAEAPA